MFCHPETKKVKTTEACLRLFLPIRSFNRYTLEIMLQYLVIGIPLSCEPFRSFLAHTDTMPPASAAEGIYIGRHAYLAYIVSTAYN